MKYTKESSPPIGSTSTVSLPTGGQAIVFTPVPAAADTIQPQSTTEVETEGPLDILKICFAKPLSADQTLSADQRAINQPGKRWKNGQTLRVRFLNGSPDIQEKVRGFANQWSLYANIIFNFVSDGDAEIRIAFKWRDTDHPNGDVGSHSLIGTDALSETDQNKPNVNFGWLDSNTADAEYQRVVL